MSAKTRYLKLMDRPRKGWKLADRAVFLRHFVEEATALIEEGLARDGVVKIHEFGTFQLKWLEARQGRNPRTGEPITIPGQYRVTFRSVQKLDSRVNWPYAHLKAEFIEPPPVRLPKVEIIPEAEPAALPAAIPLFELEEASAEPVRTQGHFGQLETPEPPQPAYLRPPISWSPASPPPSRMRFDLLEEEEEEELAPAEKFSFSSNEEFGRSDGAGRKEGIVGEIRTRPSGIVPAPVPSQRVEPHWRRPSFMQERERKTNPLRWYSGFVTVLLLLLLFFAKPIREQWSLVNGTGKIETNMPAQTTQPEANRTAKAAQPAPTTAAPAQAIGFAGGEHQVTKGDNLWGISEHYYVDPYLWPNIYRVNTDKIGNPDLLETTQILALPVLYGTHDKLSPQDRHNLAEGYFLVFNYYKQTQKHLAPFALWAAVRFDHTILDTHKEAIGEDELAFLEAHNVGDIAAR
jgi:nucleoid DNA-binding protein